MTKLCCKIVSINNFQRQSCSSKYLQDNQEKIYGIDAFYKDLGAPSRYGVMFQSAVFPKRLLRFAGVMHRWKDCTTVC